MAFGDKKSKVNVEEPMNGESTLSGPTTAQPAKLPLTKSKATKLAAAIKEGGKTKEDLMAAIDVNAAGLASQLSYLNTKGLNIAEVDPARAEFPMKDTNGVYRMGTLDEYLAKRGDGASSGIAKTRTVAELKEFVQKREDSASNKAAKAKDKHEANKADAILAMKSQIADMELQLAGLLLAAVERGDYSYESCKVSDA